MADEPAPTPLLDPEGAPSIFADAAMHFFVSDGVVRIIFSKLEPDLKGGFRNVVVGRLQMPVPGAQYLSTGLFDFLAQRGMDPRQQVTPPDQSAN